MNQEALAGPLLFLSRGRTLHATEAKGQQQVTAYEMARANWETVALRKTTLLPENRLAGLVYVDSDLAGNEMSLNILIGNEVFDFPFRKTLVDARRPRPAKDMSPEANWRGQ